ncbi:sensor histidine kinase [Nocardiopsis sp. SBT366]|uniref:sensor histidine kinase n=1 Tax=Nocardiopsis sp. SBT366 TaxID=1580529 RepID=UPI00066CAF54|nr:histidine kinase [Nocardiopsis sp. SBT366]
MNASPSVGPRRFEAYLRWSTYFATTIPSGTLFRSVVEAGGPIAAPTVSLVALGALTLALVTGNVLVANWSVDSVVGRAGRLPLIWVSAWVLVLAAFVAVTLTLPFPALGLTVAAAIGASGASIGLSLSGDRMLLLNAAALALTVALVGFGDPVLLVVGLVMVSVVLWLCWSSAWMLRVLLDLQAAHEDRAALALANERLRISRDLHDVFGRTLATMAVKSSLASELVHRGHSQRAAAEITEVRRLAQDAGSEVRRVVRGEHRTTWEDELSGARSLLESAGIRCTVTGDPVPAAHAEALAWVVREGVTNLLRHSTATRVTLTTKEEDNEMHLSVANDGAGTADPARLAEGTGLDAMSERVRAIGGRVHTGHDGDWFRLHAAIPLRRGGQA